MDMEGKKHRRSHEEVELARKAYLEAKAEKKAKQEQILRERQERRLAREKLKALSEGERAQRKHELNLAKKKIGSENVGWYYNLPVFQGNVELGKVYTVKFAGGLESGILEKIERPGIDNDTYIRSGGNSSAFYTIKSVKNESIHRYPVYREDIVAEGYWNREDKSE